MDVNFTCYAGYDELELPTLNTSCVDLEADGSNPQRQAGKGYRVHCAPYCSLILGLLAERLCG